MLTPITEQRKIWIIHLLGWTVYLFIELAVFWFSKVPTAGILNSLPYYACNIGLFYSILWVLGRHSTGTGGKHKFAIPFLLFLLAASVLLKGCWDYVIIARKDDGSKLRELLQHYLVADTFRSLNYACLAGLYWFASHVGSYRRKAAEAYSAFLQQQLNPHLLFNTLSFVHNKVLRLSPEAGDSVQLLSEIIRHGLESAGEDGKCRLSDELTQLKNIISINKYRFGPQMNLHYQLNDAGTDYRILPLVLLTLTENIFKHGEVNHGAFPAEIAVSIREDGKLHYQSFNRKLGGVDAVRRSGPVGLRNLKLRLDTAYPDNYRLDIRETATTYELQLEINLSL
jgi:two-component system LytT family sensor kinase